MDLFNTLLYAPLYSRLPFGQREDSSAQLGQAEAGGGQGIRVRQAAEIQRTAERLTLPFPGHRGQEGRRLHARAAVQPNDRQKCLDT